MNIKTTSIISIIFALALFRLMQIIPNVSPIAAMALFAGAHFSDKKLAFVVPFAALLLSDFILGFHNTMLFVYAAFAATVAIGMLLKNSLKALPIFISAISASLLFFLVTNFGVWLLTNTYAPTASGLLQSYIAGIPFYQYSLIGDLLFTAVLFGGFALLQQRFPQRASA